MQWRSPTQHPDSTAGRPPIARIYPYDLARAEGNRARRYQDALDHPVNDDDEPQEPVFSIPEVREIEPGEPGFSDDDDDAADGEDGEADPETVAAVRRVWQQRRDLWAKGYRPIAVYSPGAQHPDGTAVNNAGKRPVGDWISLAHRNPPDAVHRPPAAQSLNTAILSGEVTPFDIDVLVPEVTGQIVDLIERTLGPTPLHRIGRSPEVALWYRADVPFSKLATPVYTMPDGSEAHVEVLGDGQCCVAFGTHPDTLQPYMWPQASPCEVGLDELPVVSETEARDLLAAIDTILREAGGTVSAPDERTDDGHAAEPSPSGQKQDRSRGDGDPFFRAVNDAALDNIAAWVTALHPGFRDRGNSGWRLSSEDLGRPLEEDISVHPSGIRDFGDEEPLSAIDLVIKLGGAGDAVGAALWLCARLGINPVGLGWRDDGDKARDHDDEQTDIPDLLDVTQYPMPPPRQFLYGTEFCRTFLSGVIGAGKVGKTSLRIAQGMSVAIGEDLFRHGGPAHQNRVHIRGRVVYMTFEDDIKELNRRCWAVRKHYQIADSDLAGWFYVWAPQEKVVAEADGKIKPGPLEALLRAYIVKYRIDLLIFDPLIQVYDGDISENDNTRMNAVINIIVRLGIDDDIAVDILRHDRKGSHEAGDPDSGRGAGSVNDRGRLVRTLTHLSKEDAKKYGIGEVERRSLVRYDDAAVSLAAVQDARWFRLIGVPIGNPDNVFTTGDIVQCIEPCDGPRPLAALPDDVTEIILGVIDQGLPDGRRYSAHHSAKDRQAWKIVCRHADRSEEQAKQTIKGWLDDELLRTEKDKDPDSRKKVGGLYVSWDLWEERKSARHGGAPP